MILQILVFELHIENQWQLRFYDYENSLSQ